ncbi:hypothetical protein D3C81_1522910 [compost metagenome]
MHCKKAGAACVPDLKIMHLHRRDDDEIACMLLIFRRSKNRGLVPIQNKQHFQHRMMHMPTTDPPLLHMTSVGRIQTGLGSIMGKKSVRVKYTHFIKQLLDVRLC